MRCAAIDLGTNTFHLIIADISADDVKVIFKTNEAVKLGEGTINQQLLSDAAIYRGIETLKKFKTIIDAHQTKKIRAVATSAVRNARNGTAFVDAVHDETGIQIETISGDAEAKLIYHGVKATGVIGAASLIVDIGGGSTEFILCNEKGLHWKQSFDIGAARLMQAYFHSDPLSADNRRAIEQHLDNTLQPLLAACTEFYPRQIIGSAGAFETFAEMLTEGMNVKYKPGMMLDISAFKAYADKMLRSTHAQRVEMKGLISLRVDMIIMAILITNFVLEKVGGDTLWLSNYDLKMGVLEELRTKYSF